MITTLNLLEELRSKEELVNYFREIGENVTDEEIEKLKANYEKIEQNKNHLSMKELDEVAGGGGVIRIHQLDNIAPGQPFHFVTLTDGTTIPGCDYTNIESSTKNVFLKFGSNPIIDLSAIGKGRYAVEIVTIDDKITEPLSFGELLRHYQYAPVSLGNGIRNLSLQDLQSREPELYSAVFENQGEVSFIELQSVALRSGYTNNIKSRHEPDPPARTYLQNLIRPSNDNPVERCTIM